MKIITLVSLAMLSLLLAVFLVLLTIAIIFNFRSGLKYREKLAGKIEKLRLGKMLAALGINIDEYVCSARAVDINDQISNCSACANTRECDDRLADGSISSDDIGFCNNEEALQEVTRNPK